MTDMTDVTDAELLRALHQAAHKRPVDCTTILRHLVPGNKWTRWQLQALPPAMGARLRQLYLKGMVGRHWTAYGFRYDVTANGVESLKGNA